MTRLIKIFPLLMWHNENKGAWMCIIDNRKRTEMVNFEFGHEIKETLL